MSSQLIPRLAAIAIAASLLSACGGGGARGASALPAAPQGSGGGGATPGALVVSGAITGSGPQILAHKRRLPAAMRGSKALTFSSVTASATLYPGDAGSVPIANTAAATVSGSTYSASVSFSNVPAGNNEWVIMSFTGIAADKSQYALGELAGMVNVSGTTSNSSTLTTTTTKTAQIVLTMLLSGYLSTYDVTNTATLATSIASAITSSGVAADPGTGLFSSGGVRTIVDKVTPTYARTINVVGSPEIYGNATIVRDYTSVPELNLTSNMYGVLALIGYSTGTGLGLGGTADEFLELLGGIVGGPDCGGFDIAVGTHTPPGGNVIPGDVSACTMPFAAVATPVKGVYGGAIILGVTTDPYSGTVPSTFKGGILKVAGRAPGTVTETVTTATTAQAIVMNDPAGYAFGTESLPFVVIPSYGTGEYSDTAFEPPSGLLGSTGGVGSVYMPAVYSAASHTITVDTFNPYDVPVANLAVCSSGTLPACFPVASSSPALVRTFYDDGMHLSFFNWKASGVATAVSFTGIDYKATTSAAGAANLSTTTPTAIMPRQQITIQNTLGTGVRWTLTAKDASANTYYAYAANTPSFYSTGSSVTFEMVDVLSATTMTSLELTTTAPAGSFEFGPL